MANKFQKSVMQRLEQEADLQKKDSSITKKKESVEFNEEIPNDCAQPSVDVVDEKPAHKESVNVETNIREFLRPTYQRKAKNKTFYLDCDVIYAIKKTALEQHVTDSKLVNDILCRVLGVDR